MCLFCEVFPEAFGAVDAPIWLGPSISRSAEIARSIAAF
jgi:hypothetical protein